MATTGDTKTPVGDIRVCNACCCTVAGLNFTMPGCIGISYEGVVLCLKGHLSAYKCVDSTQNEDKKCCILQESSIVCKKPDSCCAYSLQNFCYEERAAFPCTQDVPCMLTCLPGCVVLASNKPKFACCAQVKDIFAGDDMGWKPPSSESNSLKGEKEKDLSDVDTQDLLVCNACCCSIGSLFCKMPECIGIKSEGKCLCISGEQAACKPVAAENDEGVCCICIEAGQYCVQPDTCIMGQAQYFCIDSRCAFPCNEKVPCVCAFCFLVLGPKPGCMKKVGEFTKTDVKEAQLG